MNKEKVDTPFNCSITKSEDTVVREALVKCRFTTIREMVVSFSEMAAAGFIDAKLREYRVRKVDDTWNKVATWKQEE